MLYKKANKTSYKKAVKRWPAEQSKPDSWNVNINFNLGQSQSNSSVANIKIKSLHITLNDLAGFANRS